MTPREGRLLLVFAHKLFACSEQASLWIGHAVVGNLAGLLDKLIDVEHRRTVVVAGVITREPHERVADALEQVLVGQRLLAGDDRKIVAFRTRFSIFSPINFSLADITPTPGCSAQKATVLSNAPESLSQSTTVPCASVA